MSDESPLSIGELAEASGVSRRAIRFYVQRELLQPPAGLGRGRHYGREHLERLREIQKLQAAGHSLDDIKRIVNGEQPETQPRPELFAARQARAGAAQLWLRIPVADGAELLLDTSRHALSADQLAALRARIADVLQSPPRERADDRENQS